MSTPVMLNFDQHRHTRIATARGAEYGDNVNLVPVTARELSKLVLEYPVLMTKNGETGQFELAAILGFEAAENLYLSGNKWNARYIPLHLQRQPFMVGFQAAAGASGESNNAVISIDMDSRRIHRTEGELLFQDNGEYTPYLERVKAILSDLMAGSEETRVFLSELLALDLIEPVQLDITLAEGNTRRLDGSYTINTNKLAALESDTLMKFHSRGYLMACHLMMASIGHINKLIDLKNDA